MSLFWSSLIIRMYETFNYISLFMAFTMLFIVLWIGFGLDSPCVIDTMNEDGMSIFNFFTINDRSSCWIYAIVNDQSWDLANRYQNICIFLNISPIIRFLYLVIIMTYYFLFFFDFISFVLFEFRLLWWNVLVPLTKEQKNKIGQKMIGFFSFFWSVFSSTWSICLHLFFMYQLVYSQWSKDTS